MPAIKDRMLDEEAESLYKTLELDTGYTDEYKDMKIEREEARHLLLIKAAHLLSSYFLDTHFLDGIKNRKDSFDGLVDIINELAQINDHDGNFLIRYRGYPTGSRIPAELDYVIDFAGMTVDSSTAVSILNRSGVSMSHIPGRLNKTFKIFSNHGISTLRLEIPGNGSELPAEIRKRLRSSLEIISHYNHALHMDSPIIFENKGHKVFLPLGLDEKGYPDINLTLVAGLNNLKPQTMKSVVHQVAVWMKKSGGSSYMSIYDAIAGIRSLRSRLTTPPIEVNNIRWLSIDKNHTVISKKKAKVARIATEYFKDSPRNAAQAVQTVYGDDYKEISSEHLGQRMKIATGLLDGINTDSKGKEIEEEIVTNIQERMDDIQDEVFDDLIIQKDVLKIRSGSEETVIGKVHGKIRDVVRFYKMRSEANKRAKNRENSFDFLNALDYETIAKKFDISFNNAKSLIRILKSCFNKDGHFLRTIFEKHIPIFARFEKKIFPFMWYYIKQTPEKNDRLVFLNSLQLLINRIDQPEHAIDILLSDILIDSDKVHLSDRNAFMLSNILLRTYNKEINVDIEVTPEEVLMVRNGLNRKVTEIISKKIDENQELFLEKIRAVHLKIMDALDNEFPMKESDSIRFLLYLEREIFIFLSLAGGSTAWSILRSAVKRYGDPDSEIYLLRNSIENISALIQHLTVAVRCLERLGDEQDIDLLDDIEKKEDHFYSLSMESKNVGKIQRMIYWVKKSKNNISLEIWKR